MLQTTRDRFEIYINRKGKIDLKKYSLLLHFCEEDLLRIDVHGTNHHNPDGTVIPCCLDANGIIDLGNIFKESLDDILNKQITKEIISGFQNNKAVHPLCNKCDFRERFE